MPVIIKMKHLEGASPNYFNLEYDYLSQEKSATLRRIKPKGVEVLFSGTSVSSSKTTYKRGTLTYPTGPGSFQKVLTFVRAFPAEPVHLSDVNSLRSRIKGQELNLAQFLAEAPSAMRLVKDSLTRVVKARKAFLKLNPQGVLSALSGKQRSVVPPDLAKKLGSATDVLSQNVLAWNYGVRPLLSDLNGAMKELHASYMSRPLIYSVYVSNTSTETIDNVFKNDTSFFTTGTSTNAGMWVSKRKSLCYVELEKHSWTNNASRLGFMNLAALTWELIPYSMVVDQFINIGDYLNNLDSLHGVKRVGVHRSWKSRLYSTTRFVENGTGCSALSVYSKTFSRRNYDDTLNQVFPTWKGSMISFRNILNDAALLRKAPLWRALER